MIFVKDKKTDDNYGRLKNPPVVLEKMKKITHTQKKKKDNYAMMSQGCLN